MSTYTSSLGLELITPGSQAGLWGNTTNNTFTLIDQAVTGVTPLNFASASGTIVTLTDFNGALDQARSAVLNITGSATGPNTVIIPNKQKMYLVRNNTGQDVIFQTPTPAATYTVGSGYSILIFADGNNNVFTGIQSPSVGTLPVSGGGTGNTTFGAGGFIKSAGGTTSLTVASKVNMTTEASGVLPVANGGTGQANLPAGELLVGTGTNTVAFLKGTVAGYVATWNGSSWVSAPVSSTGGVTSISAGTGITVSAPSGAVTVTNGGVTSLTASSGLTITGGTSGTGALNIALASTGLVTSFSGGTTGLTPNSATGGNVVLAGTLGISNGGTGATSASSALSALGGARLGGSNTFTGAQETTGLGSASPGWTATGAGLQSFISPSSLQLGYGGVGFFAGSSSTLDMNTSIASISITGTIMDWSGPGDAYKPGGGVWAALSDERLKENVAPLTGCLNTITALNPVSYDWKYASTEPTVGFIAQEVSTVLATAIDTRPAEGGQLQHVAGDVYAVGFKNDFFAYLVGAIKELKAELDAANARIAALEAQ